MWKRTVSIMALSIFTAPQKRACRKSLVPHIDACMCNRTDRFFGIQGIGEDCQTMAGGIVFVHGEAGRQQGVLQIMKRAT